MASGGTHRQSHQLPPLDGGGDEDADTGTKTSAPGDDNDDIASFTSQQTTAIQTSKPVNVPHDAPLLATSFSIAGTCRPL